jgi:hypothetical protein
MSSQIINNLYNIENYSYLELGVNNNHNFNSIRSLKKFSVDMNGEAMYTGTTDEYFETLPVEVKFDIIFIDANHDYDYVLRDFNNSIDHATKWILLHDMIPPSEKYTQSNRCSDSFKLLYFMLQQTSFEIYPMDSNYGFTLIKLPATKIYPSEEYKLIPYASFMEFIQTKKLYSEQEIIDILRNQNV